MKLHKIDVLKIITTWLFTSFPLQKVSHTEGGGGGGAVRFFCTADSK